MNVHFHLFYVEYLKLVVPLLVKVCNDEFDYLEKSYWYSWKSLFYLILLSSSNLTYSVSCGHKIIMARPVRPARAVLPTRWTKSDKSCGGVYWMTKSTLGTSSPRAATSWINFWRKKKKKKVIHTNIHLLCKLFNITKILFV